MNEFRQSILTNDNYYDISPVLESKTATFPGDQTYQRNIKLDTRKGDHITLSSIHTTLHLGSHADAPLHYNADGKSIEQVDLSYFLGPCQVIGVEKDKSSRIFPQDLPTQNILAPRVLFRTNSFANPCAWNSDFTALSPELIQFLAQSKVCLVGVDTPSVDLADDKVLRSHHAIFEHNMVILEGLLLKNVPDGVYTLVALPLRLKDGDASPVRAILMKEKIQ